MNASHILELAEHRRSVRRLRRHQMTINQAVQHDASGCLGHGQWAIDGWVPPDVARALEEIEVHDPILDEPLPDARWFTRWFTLLMKPA